MMYLIEQLILILPFILSIFLCWYSRKTYEMKKKKNHGKVNLFLMRFSILLLSASFVNAVLLFGNNKGIFAHAAFFIILFPLAGISLFLLYTSLFAKEEFILKINSMILSKLKH